MNAQAIRKREAEETHQSDIVGDTWAYMDRLCSCPSQVTLLELKELRNKFNDLLLETGLVRKEPSRKLFGPPAVKRVQVKDTPSGAEAEIQEGKHEETHYRNPWKYVDCILSRSSGQITQVDMENIKNSFGDFFRKIDLRSKTNLVQTLPYVVKIKNVDADAAAIRKGEAEETHQSDIVGVTWAYMDRLCSCPGQVTSVELKELKNKFDDLLLETDRVRKDPPRKLFGPPSVKRVQVEDTPSGAEGIQKGKHEEAHYRNPWKYVDSILSRSSGQITQVDMENIKNSFGDFFRKIDLRSKTNVVRTRPYVVKIKTLDDDALNPSNSVGSAKAIRKRELEETHQSDIVGETWAYMDRLCSCPSQVTSVELKELKNKFDDLLLETDLVRKDPSRRLFGPPDIQSVVEAEIQKGKHEEAHYRNPWKYMDSVLSRSSGQITQADMENIKNSFGNFFRKIDLRPKTNVVRTLPYVVQIKTVDADALNPSSFVGSAKQEQVEEVTKCAEELKPKRKLLESISPLHPVVVKKHQTVNDSVPNPPTNAEASKGEH